MTRQLDLYCFDPGGTTGFGKLRIEAESQKIMLLDIGEFETWTGLDLILPEIPKVEDPIDQPVVICEHLTAQHPSFRQIGIEVMGAIEYLCFVHTLKLVLQPPVMMQPPRQIHPLKKDIKSQHARDAVHHGIAFAYREFNTRFDIQFGGEEEDETETGSTEEE